MKMIQALQELTREWEWRDLGMGSIIAPGRDEHGNLAAYSAAIAYNPRTGETKVLCFDDEQIEPFRQMAKDMGYPSIEDMLEVFLKSKAYLEDDKPCQQPQQPLLHPPLPPPARLLRR